MIANDDDSGRSKTTACCCDACDFSVSGESEAESQTCAQTVTSTECQARDRHSEAAQRRTVAPGHNGHPVPKAGQATMNTWQLRQRGL